MIRLLRVPMAVFGSLYRHWPLIRQSVWREVAGRYVGSSLGVVWSFVTPLLMLSIYTFVFGGIFKSRWRSQASDPVEFAVVMFSGFIVHAFIADCLQRSPTVIVGKPNFVKKIVFPLETFAWVTVFTAVFHFLIALLILGIALVVWRGSIPWSFVLIPIVMLPLVVLTAGIVWIVSALGVYLRDIGQVMGIATSFLMFLAPVFYPLHSAPAGIVPYLYLNPITFIIEQIRNVAIWGTPVNWSGWALYWVPACALACVGWLWFARLRTGFADVI